MVFTQFIKLALYFLAMVPVWTLLVTVLFPYSHTHPDYAEFKTMIENLDDDTNLDFSNLNDGGWKTACIFGSYTNPSYFMNKHGNIGWIDYLYQPMKAWPIIRLSKLKNMKP